MNLTTQAEQVACFRNAAAHLEPGGCFVIEVGVPDLQRLPPGETVRAVRASATAQVGFDEYDVADQRLISHHMRVTALEPVSMPFRYVWPGELDLMAQLAGLRAARPLERLAARAVHEREPRARLGVVENPVAPVVSTAQSTVHPASSHR